MNESAIEKAAEAIVEAANRYGTKHMSIDLADYLARAAYPHLSVWEEPTPEEWHSLHESSICLYGEGVRCRAVSQGIRQFLLMRNHRNAPPVDPRREAAINFLKAEAWKDMRYEVLADRFLAAIDEARVMSNHRR